MQIDNLFWVNAGIWQLNPTHVYLEQGPTVASEAYSKTNMHRNPALEGRLPWVGSLDLYMYGAYRSAIAGNAFAPSACTREKVSYAAFSEGNPTEFSGAHS